MLVNQPIGSHSKYYYVTGSGFIYLILCFVSLASLEINKLLEGPYLFCSLQRPWYPIQCHTGRYSTQQSLNNSQWQKTARTQARTWEYIGLVPDNHNTVKTAMEDCNEASPVNFLVSQYIVKVTFTLYCSLLSVWKWKWSRSLSRVRLCHPMDCGLPGSSVHGISRQEYWSGLPFPSPGDLPKLWIKPASPALADGFFLYHWAIRQAPEKPIRFTIIN